MVSDHLILCHPLPFPSVFPSIRSFQWVSSSRHMARILELLTPLHHFPLFLDYKSPTLSGLCCLPPRPEFFPLSLICYITPTMLAFPFIQHTQLAPFLGFCTASSTRKILSQLHTAIQKRPFLTTWFKKPPGHSASYGPILSLSAQHLTFYVYYKLCKTVQLVPPSRKVLVT